MRSSLVLSAIMMAGSSMAQGDINAFLQPIEDLQTLHTLIGMVEGLADLLSSSTNITIFAPTDEAFAKVPRDIPEGEAIEYMNDTIAIGALLANHVFKGVYPSSAASDIPIFAQSLLDSSYVNYRQPFSNFTGGQYNGIVKNGDDVCVLSGELTVSTVTEADIKLGEGITIHKIDTVLSFGAPLQLFTYRAGYTALNAALTAADLNIDFGLGDEGATTLNISDFTVLVPTNEAFERIGSVLESADVATIQEVLRYHIIPSNVIFSPSLGNVSVKSFHGDELTFTVLPDGSAWVNNAKITFTNNILYNGVAHVIDNVLAPGSFDRSTLNPSAPSEDRLSFPNAMPVDQLPFSSVSFFDDLMSYTTTPVLLQTLAAVDTSFATATTTSSTAAAASPTNTAGGINGPIPTAAGVESVVMSRALMAGAVLFGVGAAAAF